MAAESNNRCWPGYEPVKGKKKHSQGSCQPKEKSKLTDSEKSFRAKRRRQLADWQAKHPHSKKSAAQHLGAPGEQRKKAISRTKKRKSAASPSVKTGNRKVAKHTS